MSEFDCPRCGTVTTADYYGPCPTCCEALRKSQQIEPKIVEGSSNVYKMNVTPNAVALKADD